MRMESVDKALPGGLSHTIVIRIGAEHLFAYVLGHPTNYVDGSQMTALRASSTRNRDEWWRTVPYALPIAFICAGLSLFQTISYDEYYWLAVTRKLALGSQLYESMLDNKGPLWYLFPRLVDIVPGSYQTGRFVVFLFVAIGLIVVCERILNNLEVAREARVTLAGCAVVFAFAASLFNVSVEILGVVIVGAAFAVGYRRPWIAGGLFLAATLVDPRLALFVPAAIFMSESRSFSWHRALAVGTLPGIGVLLYFLLPDLRFAVIEFGLATRPTEAATLRNHLPILIVIGLPILVSIWRLTDRFALKWTISGALTASAAVLFAATSVAPFTHYWIYLALPLAMFTQMGQPTDRSRLTVVLVALSLFPLLAYGFVLDVNRRGEQRPYEVALSILGANLAETDKVLNLTFVPYPMAQFPEIVEGPAPVSYPYFLETSRLHDYLAEFETDLADADAVWVDAPDGPDDTTALEQFEVPLGLIDASGRFTCTRTVPPFVVFEAGNGPC